MNKLMKTNEGSIFPTKKDYFYTVTIFIIVMICFASHIVVDIGAVNGKLSFAGTVTSIILSVIAIVYTLVESVRGTGTLEKTSESADKISDALVDLKELLGSLQQSSSDISEVEKLISDINNVKELVVKQETKIDLIRNKIDESRFVDESSKEAGSLDIDRAEMINRLTKPSGLYDLFVMVVKLLESKPSLSTDKVARTLVGDKPYHEGVYIGVLAMLNHLDFIIYVNVENDYYITEIDDDLKVKVISDSRFNQVSEEIEDKISAYNQK